MIYCREGFDRSLVLDLCGDQESPAIQCLPVSEKREGLTTTNRTARASVAYSLNFKGMGPSSRNTAAPKMPMTVGVIGVRASGPKCR